MTQMTARETIASIKKTLEINSRKLEEYYETDRIGRENLELNAAKVLEEEKLLSKYPWSVEYETWCDGIKLVATEFNLKGWPELAEVVREGDMLTLMKGVALDTTDEFNISIVFGMEGGWREILPAFVKKFGIKLDATSILNTIESVEATTRLLRSMYDEALHANSSGS